MQQQGDSSQQEKQAPPDAPSIPVQTGTEDVNGISVYYELHGEAVPGRMPILFLQGISGELTSWKPFLQWLVASQQCLLVDNRDSGLGDRSSKSYTIEDMADDVAGLLQILQLQCVHVVGHSMGGCIALALACKYPERVAKLFLASTTARAARYNGFHIASSWKYLAEMGAPRRVIAQQFTAVCMSPSYIETHPNAPMYEWDQVSQTAEDFARQCDAFLKFDVIDRLPEIGAPTLVYVGDQDIFTPLFNSRELHEAIPGSILFVNEGFSHASIFEDIYHTIHIVRNWFA